jgi:DNA mismatch endonuclease (patch repair protein)
MTDVYSPEKRSDVMRRVQGEDTGPERLVRRTLHLMGHRFRIHYHALPGSPDVAFLGRRAVIFVHGCFWHGHKGCKHSRRPTSNVEFWKRKLDRNIQRDRKNIRTLRRTGWKVLVIWECQTKDEGTVASILRRFIERLAPNNYVS